MWDSAKKPIKVRSVLQPNGMRHFIVNDQVDEDVHDIKSLLHNNHQQRRSSNKTTTTRPSTINEGETGNDNNNAFTTEDCKNNTTGASSTLPRSFPVNDASSSTDPSWENNSSEDFFGVSGSKIYNSKKHKGQHSRFLHQFPHSIKTNIEITRYPAAHFDLIPVKSPVIKKLINGRVDSSTAAGHLKVHKGNGQPPATSTTLCSRIMTWIDLEVKRNASGGTKIKSSTGSTSNTLSPSIPFSSADLSIVNDLYEYQSKLEGFLSSPLSPTDRSSSSSTASSTSGDGGSTNSASSCSSTSSSVSLPKLIPCWRKDGSSNLAGCGGGNKAKKSVRIAEDLPRWGKMKRRLRRKTLSLNELYDDDEQPFLPSSTSSSSSYHNNDRSIYNNKSSSKTDYFGGSKLNDKTRKEYSSVSDLMEERSFGNLPRVGEHQGASGFRRCNESPDKETDSFVVCDERLLTSGKVQVHIFLPQTE